MYARATGHGVLVSHFKVIVVSENAISLRGKSMTKTIMPYLLFSQPETPEF